ncbi:hypothetical protein V6N13_017976 [Hibiscus sabdariffa]|uniref:Uncharacterized protein n=1 Tax=Hibiscus sabdariffa TaxID=183260 RepID=A0ABR2CGW1_9ROSI
MTPETDKYDPACPICTLGEKKAFQAEVCFKGKINRRSRYRFVNGDIDNDSAVFNRLERKGLEGKASGSNMKSSSSRSFLWKQLSFGSKGSRSTRKKGLFWTKSCKT